MPRLNRNEFQMRPFRTITGLLIAVLTTAAIAADAPDQMECADYTTMRPQKRPNIDWVESNSKKGRFLVLHQQPVEYPVKSIRLSSGHRYVGAVPKVPISFLYFVPSGDTLVIRFFDRGTIEFVGLERAERFVIYTDKIGVEQREPIKTPALRKRLSHSFDVTGVPDDELIAKIELEVPTTAIGKVCVHITDASGPTYHELIQAFGPR